MIFLTPQVNTQRVSPGETRAKKVSLGPDSGMSASLPQADFTDQASGYALRSYVFGKTSPHRSAPQDDPTRYTDLGKLFLWFIQTIQNGCQDGPVLVRNPILYKSAASLVQYGIPESLSSRLSVCGLCALKAREKEWPTVQGPVAVFLSFDSVLPLFSNLF